MSTIKPFKIAIPDERLQRLKQQLAVADFPNEVVDEEPWVRGVPLAELKSLSQYWQDEYDWRKEEARLNAFPHYTTDIAIDGFETYNVHFVHQPSTVKNAIPLLFAHGWPGCFLEGLKMLPDLIKGSDNQPAFHVVIPSLIDYGFSSASLKKGFAVTQHAEACHKLMLRLGYTTYISQGGDLGYGICRLLAQNYPQHCKAHHINMPLPKEPTAEAFPKLHAKWQSQKSNLSASDHEAETRSKNFYTTGFAYYQLHATKPQTIGSAISASPISLLAWIYEKLHSWSDTTHYHWTATEILTWISIYYFSTAGPAASQRIYYEEAHSANPSFVAGANYIEVPLGIANFPKELTARPRLWNLTLGPVVHESEWEYGGHFAAYERPEAIVSDLRAMMGRGGGAEGVCGVGRGGFE